MRANHGMRLGTLVFLHLLVDFYGGLLLPLPEPTLILHYGVSLSRVMLLISASAILVNVVQPLSGFLLPQRRLPLLLWLSPLLAAMATFVGLSGRYWVGGLLLLVSGLGVGLMHPEAAATAQALSGKRMGLATSVFMSAGFLGFSIGSLVGGQWGRRLGLDYFWILSAPALLGAGLAWKSGLASTRLTMPPAAGEESGKEVLPFGIVFALSALMAINLTILYRIFPVYWVRRFGPAAQGQAGTLLFLIGLAGTCGSFVWGALSDRFGAGRVLAAVYLFGLPWATLLLLGPGSGRIYAWAALLGVTVAGSFPLAVVLARRAKAFSVRLRLGLCIGGAWGLGELSVIAISALIDRADTQDYTTPRAFLFLCPGLMLLVAALSVRIAWLRKRMRRLDLTKVPIIVGQECPTYSD